MRSSGEKAMPIPSGSQVYLLPFKLKQHYDNRSTCYRISRCNRYHYHYHYLSYRYFINRVYNKILDRDWFPGRIFVT